MDNKIDTDHRLSSLNCPTRHWEALPILFNSVFTQKWKSFTFTIYGGTKTRAGPGGRAGGGGGGGGGAGRGEGKSQCQDTWTSIQGMVDMGWLTSIHGTVDMGWLTSIHVMVDIHSWDGWHAFMVWWTSIQGMVDMGWLISIHGMVDMGPLTSIHGMVDIHSWDGGYTFLRSENPQPCQCGTPLGLRMLKFWRQRGVCVCVGGGGGGWTLPWR